MSDVSKFLEPLAPIILPYVEGELFNQASPKVKSMVGTILSWGKTEWLEAAKKTVTTLDDVALSAAYDKIQLHFTTLGKPNLVADIDAVVQL